MKRIQDNIRTPNTHEWALRFIKKSIKNSGKIQTLKFIETRYLYHVSPKVSWDTKFEGSNWKIVFRYAKITEVTWSAIMRISNGVWYSYSIPKNVKSNEKNSSYHVDNDDWLMEGRTDKPGWIPYTPHPPKNFVVWGIMNCPNCSSEWSISLYLLPWWAKLSKYALWSNLLFSLWWPLILDEPASSPRACVKHLKTCKTGGLRKKST